MRKIRLVAVAITLAIAAAPSSAQTPPGREAEGREVASNADMITARLFFIEQATLAGVQSVVIEMRPSDVGQQLTRDCTLTKIHADAITIHCTNGGGYPPTHVRVPFVTMSRVFPQTPDGENGRRVLWIYQAITTGS